MNKLGKLFIEEKPVYITKEDKSHYNDDVNKFVETLKEKLNNVKEEKDKKERAEKLDDLFKFIVDNKKFLNIQEKQFCDLKKNIMKVLQDFKKKLGDKYDQIFNAKKYEEELNESNIVAQKEGKEE